MKTYAGIGSRRAPNEILGLCIRVARRLNELGWVLRTGHAIGCDQAFEVGAVGSCAEVFLPWKDFESDTPIDGLKHIMPTVAALQMVERVHPTPDRLSMAATRLHARNCHILLGLNLDSPVDRVVCWTPNENRGGTAFGLRIAREHDIPVHNLNDPIMRAAYEALCDRKVTSPPPWPNL